MINCVCIVLLRVIMIRNYLWRAVIGSYLHIFIFIRLVTYNFRIVIWIFNKFWSLVLLIRLYIVYIFGGAITLQGCYFNFFSFISFVGRTIIVGLFRRTIVSTNRRIIINIIRWIIINGFDMISLLLILWDIGLRHRVISCIRIILILTLVFVINPIIQNLYLLSMPLF